MSKTSLRASIIAGALLLVSGAAHCAGLGKLTVLTHLGEPLKAEIDVVAVEKGELETLTAKLSSPEAYAQSNLPYPNPSLGLRLSVEQHSNGQPYIRVTSAQPVPEPFVDLLVELNWNGGKIQRAYTALLDPPDFGAVPPTPVERAPTLESAKPAPSPEPAVETKLGTELQRPTPPEPPAAAPPEPTPAEPKPPEEMAPAAGLPEAAPAEAGMPVKPPPPPPAPKEETYGPVKRGDNLSKIAKEYKPDDVTLDQMLVLLFRSNKHAFAGSNMNRLKTGKVLTIPDSSEASGITVKEARKQVRLQVADFNAYRERLASASSAAAPPLEQSGKAAGGRVTSPVPDKGAPALAEPKEVLKLSPGGSKAAQDKVHSLEEELAARDKTIRDANERIAKLEKTVKDMNALLELKNKPMADLQKPAMPPATPAKPATSASPPATPPVTATPPVIPPAITPPAKPAVAPTPAAPLDKPDVIAQPSPMPASGTQPGVDSAQPKPKPKAKVVAPPPPARSMVDDLLEEPLYLAAGGGILVLILGFVGYRVIRSRRGVGGDEQAEAEKKNSELKEFAAIGADSSSGAMEAAARAAQAQIAEEVDPLAEAEIYLAYGRDGQAEEILKEALQSHPRRFEVHVKLLEIYAKRNDLAAFDSLARDLQQATGGQGEFWLQAARLGYQLEPQNARYLAGKPSGEAAVVALAAAGTATADKTLDFQIDSLDSPPEIGTLTDIDAGLGRHFATSTAVTSEHLDLNIGVDDGPLVGTKTDIDLDRLGSAADSSAMDLDLDSLDRAGGGGSTSTAIDLASFGGNQTTQMPSMNFDVPLPEGEEKTESQVAKVDSVDFDLKLDDFGGQAVGGMDGGLDFDINEPSFEPRGADKAEPALDLDVKRSAAAMPEIDLSSISLDLGEATPSGSESGSRDDKWYDVQTKFDLAKAYQEMGDKEGAREILHEVIAEGDSDQQVAAKQLLGTLG